MYKNEEFLTIREFANRVHYGERQIRQKCIDGKIKASKSLGRKWLIPSTELENFGSNPNRESDDHDAEREDNISSSKFSQLPAKDIRKSDLITFRESNVLLSEKWLINFLDDVDSKRSYLLSQTDCVLNFIKYFRYESNQYVGKDRQKECRDLCKVLQDLYEFLAVNNCTGSGEEDKLYQLFPRSDPIFSLYLDRTCGNVDMTFEEICKRHDEYIGYIHDENNRKEFASFMTKHLHLIYEITEPNLPFTMCDYKREYSNRIKQLTVLLNKVERQYRTYRSLIKRTLGK
jgi:excisionase family DNA binding protein